MVDIFALSIAHGLLVLVALRLMTRDSLDSEGEARPRFGARLKPPLSGNADDDGADHQGHVRNDRP